MAAQYNQLQTATNNSTNLNKICWAIYKCEWMDLCMGVWYFYVPFNVMVGTKNQNIPVPKKTLVIEVVVYLVSKIDHFESGQTGIARISTNRNHKINKKKKMRKNNLTNSNDFSCRRNSPNNKKWVISFNIVTNPDKIFFVQYLPAISIIGTVGNPSFLPVSGTSIVGGFSTNGIIVSFLDSFLSVLGDDLRSFLEETGLFCGGGAVIALASFRTEKKRTPLV